MLLFPPKRLFLGMRIEILLLGFDFSPFSIAPAKVFWFPFRFDSISRRCTNSSLCSRSGVMGDAPAAIGLVKQQCEAAVRRVAVCESQLPPPVYENVGRADWL